MECYFNHEKLEVYQSVLRYIKWLQPILKKIPKTATEHDQLDRASTSMALNIAEGNGKYKMPDRCRYFDIAYGSGMESAAGLDTSVVKEYVTEEEVIPGKEQLRHIVNMLMGLIKKNSTDRVYEEEGVYGINES